MDLDVRLPMGLMFLIIGAVLVVVGLTSQAPEYARALGINLNLWWGLVMCGLGAVMLLLVMRARPRNTPRH